VGERRTAFHPFSLEVAEADGGALKELEQTEPVQVWKGPAGDVSALGYSAGGYCWMRWPGFATYRFRPVETLVTAFPETVLSRPVLEDTWLRSVLPHVFVARGQEALHASAVTLPHGRGVVALCGPSGTGKSTLAYGLDQHGFRQFADDSVVLHEAPGERTRAMPLPFTRRVDAATSLALGRPTPSGWQTSSQESAPLAAICLLERATADSPTALVARRVSGSEALVGVLAHAHVFDPGDPVRMRRALETFLRTIDRVPVFAVAIRSGLADWPAVADAWTSFLRKLADGQSPSG
jgi:hypothetical protein